MSAIKHSGYIESDFTGDPHCAKCSCGWESPARLTQIEAEADLQKHYAESKQECSYGPAGKY